MFCTADGIVEMAKLGFKSTIFPGKDCKNISMSYTADRIVEVSNLDHRSEFIRAL